MTHDDVIFAAAVAAIETRAATDEAYDEARALAEEVLVATRHLIEDRAEADLRERLAAAIHRDYEAAVEAGHSEEFLRVYLAANTEAMRVVRTTP